MNTIWIGYRLCLDQIHFVRECQSSISWNVIMLLLGTEITHLKNVFKKYVFYGNIGICCEAPSQQQLLMICWVKNAAAAKYIKLHWILLCFSFRENLPGQFKFKDYCPQVFRNLRERFGIEDQDYQVKLQIQCKSALDCANKKPWTEKTIPSLTRSNYMENRDTVFHEHWA